MNALTPFADLPRWVAWQTERNPQGRVTKLPYSPAGGMARANDPATWGKLEAAQERAKALPRPFGVGGIGFELGDLGTGKALGGVDLDSCRDRATGELEPWAADLIRRFGSYAEVSPSGTGAKLFFHYDPAALPDLLRVMGTAGGKKWARGKGEHAPAIELYLTGRYFAFTAQRLEVSPADVRHVSRETLEKLIRRDGPAFAQVGDNTAEPSSADADIERVAALPGAPRLLAGDFAHLNDQTRSGVAMAMAHIMKRAGFSFDDACAFLRSWEHTADWCEEKGDANNARELQRLWGRCAAIQPTGGAEFTAIERTGRIRLLSPADCEAAPGRGYTIKHLLAPGDVACIFGQPGAGKSIVAPHLGYAVAQGRMVFGRRTKPGRVFYIAAEDSLGIRQRVHAIKLRDGDAPDFRVVEGVSNLLDADEAAAVRGLIEQHKPTLVFIDTLAMACPGIDENTSQDMGRVVAMARGFTAHGAAVVLIHHDTKDGNGTPRGHSILNGALDVAMQLSPADDSGIIRGRLRKNRNGPCDGTIAFRIRAVPIGVDDDGDTITAPVAVEVSDAPAAAVKLPRTAAAALDVLREMVATEGRTTPDNRTVVSESDWRRECADNRRISSAEDRESRSKAFRRAYDALLDRKQVEAAGGLVWLPVAPEFAAAPLSPLSPVASSGDESSDQAVQNVAQSEDRTDRTKPDIVRNVRPANRPERPDGQDTPLKGCPLSGPAMPRQQNNGTHLGNWSLPADIGADFEAMLQ